MPNLPSSPEHLKLTPDKNRLYSKFQSYKLHAYSEEDLLERIALPIPPSRQTLPVNARVGFQDVRVRTEWNHLSQGWDGQSVLYVGGKGEIVRIQASQAQEIASIPLGKRTDVYGYYPDLVEVESNVLVATDGLGQLYVLRNGSVLGSLQEDIPFVLFDAGILDNDIYVLICQTLHSPSKASTSRPPQGEYVLRKLRLNVSSTLTYEVITSLSGAEIPKHAVLTPDILLVSQSPFHYTSAPPDPEAMELEDDSPPPPLYTYFQSPTDLDISIPLPLNTPKSSIQINFSTSTLQLRFLPPTATNSHTDLSETFPFQTAEEKPLWGAIDPMNSTWTLSSTSASKVLDIHLEKLPGGESHWPQVFEDHDGAEEYTDPSDRSTILDRLEKYTQSNAATDDSDAVRKRFLLEEDEDIDSVDAGDVIQLFKGTRVAEAHGHDLLATSFDRRTLGVKVSIDMCVFDVVKGHEITFPAFNFVASSKRLRKYCRFTERFAVIVESGRGGNMYVYYMPQDGLLAKQLVVRLGVESLGIGVIRGNDVVVIGEGDQGFEAVIIGGL